MIQIAGWPMPRIGGRIQTWVTPMIMAVIPSIDPTERSILRVTITSTMPVAMTAIEDVWTERFQRLRVVRKAP